MPRPPAIPDRPRRRSLSSAYPYPGTLPTRKPGVKPVTHMVWCAGCRERHGPAGGGPPHMANYPLAPRGWEPRRTYARFKARYTRRRAPPSIAANADNRSRSPVRARSNAPATINPARRLKRRATTALTTKPNAAPRRRRRVATPLEHHQRATPRRSRQSMRRGMPLSPHSPRPQPLSLQASPVPGETVEATSNENHRAHG